MRWPRMMKRRTAAEYCDLSEQAFEREVFAGRLPCAVMLGNREHWDKLALDKALAALSGHDELPEWEAELYQKRA